MSGRRCHKCDEWKDSDQYSNNQWYQKGDYARCKKCVELDVGRKCADCGDMEPASNYSTNQWWKGSGQSKCKWCVNKRVRCDICGKNFIGMNQLKQHKQVHLPRNVRCPGCGEQRFRRVADAVAHYENGYCDSCRDVSQAQRNVKNFAKSIPALNGMLRLTNGDNNEQHLECPKCYKRCRQHHSLLRHLEDAHGIIPFMNRSS